MKKSLWTHERELETLIIVRDKMVDSRDNQKTIDAQNHAIFMKAAFIDQNFFEKIPLENIDPDSY
jgi:hypothetical protein